jgi:UDP-N-acetylmuramyl pentapeptide synthase
VPALVEALPTIIQRGDTVLVKASHAIGFEKIVAALEQLTL